MKFKSYLVLLESQEDDLMKAGEIIKKYSIEDKRKDRVDDAIELLTKALEADTIFNVDFGNAKEGLKYAIERAWDARFKEFIGKKTVYATTHKIPHWDNEEKAGEDVNSHRALGAATNNVVHSFIDFQSAAKTKRALDTVDVAAESKKVNKDFGVLIDQLKELAPAVITINNVLKALKPKIVKGRKPNPNADPNAFHSKMGSKEAQDLVKKEIKKGIDKPLDALEEALEKWLQSQIDYIAKLGSYEYQDYRKRDHNITNLITQCFEYDHEYVNGTNGAKFYNLKVNARGKGFAKKEAHDTRIFLEEKFLYKNVRKLSDVVDQKANLVHIEILPTRPVEVRHGEGTIEAGFKFIFADKSQFTVINKIVSKYSASNTHFHQFPTTFHDVTFSDGKKMKVPSEEKMVKEFAKDGK